VKLVIVIRVIMTSSLLLCGRRCGLQMERRACARLLFTSPCRPVYEVVEARQTPTAGLAIQGRIKKLNFPPFVKDIFCGRFNKSVMSYAEVLSYERHRALDCQLEEVRRYWEGRQEAVLPRLPEWLHQAGLAGLTGPGGPAGGKDLLHTEAARLYEEVGREPAASDSLYCSEFLGCQAVMQFGSERQKQRYLQPLLSGELLATLAVQEAAAGSDASGIETEAAYDVDTDTYSLRGRKTWVPNSGSAGLFVVIAKTVQKNYMGLEESGLTAFLVDSEASGVTVGQQYHVGAYDGLQLADVEFDCKVGAGSVLGEKGDGATVLQTLQHQNKFLAVAGLLVPLRSIISQVVEHCNTSKQFGLPLSKFSLVKLQLSEMESRLYSLESMLYLTAGLRDVAEYPDVDMESAIVKQFAAQTSQFIVKTSLGLLGRAGLDEGGPLQRFTATSQFLQGWHGTANIIKCHIAISGLVHLAQQAGPAIARCSKPLPHLLSYLRWSRTSAEHKWDQVRLTHKLSDCVHPRLISSAERLEWAVEKIPFLATNMMFRSDMSFNIPETELVKLADIAIETFAMTCTLSRANRSYIVGHAHGEHEVNIAIPVVNEGRLLVQQLGRELMDWEGEDEARMDQFWSQTGYTLASTGRYFPAHPLTIQPPMTEEERERCKERHYDNDVNAS